MIGKFLAGVLGGFILAILIAIFGLSVFMSDPKEFAGGTKVLFFLSWCLAMIVCIRSLSVKKAWRRMLYGSSIMSIMLPVGFFLFSVIEAVRAGGESNFVHGGAMITSLMLFVGLPLAVVFFLLGKFACKENEEVNNN